jgi:hypothetical protein
VSGASGARSTVAETHQHRSAGAHRQVTPELVLHARQVQTIFDLFARDENEMTAALGWGLTHNTALLRARPCWACWRSAWLIRVIRA